MKGWCGAGGEEGWGLAGRREERSKWTDREEEVEEKKLERVRREEKARGDDWRRVVRYLQSGAVAGSRIQPMLQHLSDRWHKRAQRSLRMVRRGRGEEEGEERR